MDLDEIKRLIRVHAGFDLDELNPGILSRLRPYVGIREMDFAEIINLIILLHPSVIRSSVIEPEICAALWSICESARTLALRSGSAVRRNHLASDDVLEQLSNWISAIEIFSIRMLRGVDLLYCLFPVKLVADGKTQDQKCFHFLLPVIKVLHDSDDDIEKDYFT